MATRSPGHITCWVLGAVVLLQQREGGVGMGQCLRHQMHWEDLEEYQVGRSARRLWEEGGAGG